MLRIIILLLITSMNAYADTMDHFMHIAESIPKMEMKVDPRSQAWARSARNILVLTSESVSESLVVANDAATKAGKPLFCLPRGTRLTGTDINELIQKTYRDLSSQTRDKNKMTVSQIALLGISKQYPCDSRHSDHMANAAESMVHMSRVKLN
jgi:hypothetical protein